MMDEDDFSNRSTNKEKEASWAELKSITDKNHRTLYYRREQSSVTQGLNHPPISTNRVSSSLLSNTNHQRQHENIYRTTFIDNHQRNSHSATTPTRYHSREKIDIDSQQQNFVDQQTRTRHASTVTFGTETTKQQE